MRKAIIRRVSVILLTLIMVSAAVFMMQSLSLGDSSAYILSEEASEEEIAEYRRSQGLDDPVLVRYLRFLAAFVSGSWGKTVNGNEISALILQRLPVTISLALFSALLALAISVPLSIMAAKNRRAGKAVSALAILLMASPSFLTALFLVSIFSLSLGIFPPAGYIPPGDSLAGYLRSMFLPSLTLALLHSALYLRIFRKALEENLDSPFSLSMLSMGVRRRDLVRRSALKPSLPVLYTLIASSLASSAAGAAVTETVFALPGIGSLLVSASLSRDVSLSGTLMMLIALSVSVIYALLEIVLLVSDPRARRGR